MNNDELIEYAIRTSNAIKEEIKPKLIDYFYKQKGVINKATEWVRNWMHGTNDWFEEDSKPSELLDILKEVSE